MEFAVGVIELRLTARSRCRGIGYADLAAGIIETYLVGVDVCLERVAFGCHCIRIELVAVALDLDTEFYGIAILAGRKAVGRAVGECIAVIAAAHRIGLDVLTFQSRAVAGEADILAQIAGAKYDLAVHVI